MFSPTPGIGDEPHWHPQPGDALEDPWELAGMALCLFSIGTLAMTLTAIASGHQGWAILAGLVTLALFLTGLSIVRLEYVREHRAEERYGRHGHNPLVKAKWRGSPI